MHGRYAMQLSIIFVKPADELLNFCVADEQSAVDVSSLANRMHVMHVCPIRRRVKQTRNTH